MSTKCTYPQCTITLDDEPLFRTGDPGYDPQWMCHAHATKTGRKPVKETVDIVSTIHQAGTKNPSQPKKQP